MIEFCISVYSGFLQETGFLEKACKKKKFAKTKS